MAIVQISKIQQRSGNLVDLPQLDDAEFGWANDAKRLFIGKTTPNENIEILTSYSTISFSQLDGSVGNLNISNVTLADGQILTYDGTDWTNRGGDAGGLITLGNVSNVKITGGAVGYVLSTDGLGNLSWSPKGTLVADILNVTKANPAVVTTVNDNFFTDGSQVTIVDPQGMTELAGNIYYANAITSTTFALYTDSGLTTGVNSSSYNAYSYTTVSGTNNSTNRITVANSAPFTANSAVKFIGDLSTSGIVANTIYYILGSPPTSTTIKIATSPDSNTSNVVSLQTTSGLTAEVYQTNGQAVATLGTTVTFSPAGGSDTQIQYNDTGGLQGSGLFTYDYGSSILTLVGNANVSNLNATGVVVASRLSSNVATGTAPLIVTSTTQVANLNVATSGSVVNGNSNVNIPAANGNVTISAIGNANIVVVTGTGVNVAGTFNASGNANVGNLGTGGLITATGNITGGNLVTAGVANIGANANVAGNLNVTANANITANVNANNANITSNVNANNVIAGNLVSGTLLTGTLTTAAQPNITSVGTLTSLSVTGNVTAGNLVGILANGTSNVSIPTASGNVNISAAGSANLVVITSTGVNVAGTLNATGNANTQNLGTGQVLASANVTAPQLISNIATGTAPLVVTSTTQVANLNVATAGAATNASALLQNTSSATTVYPTFTTSSANGNSSAVINTAISANLANGAIIATTFVGNVSGNISGTLTAPGSNTQVIFNDAGNANATSGLTFNKSTNLLTVTGNVSGGNLTTAGALSVTGNANVGNLGTTGLITATGNVSGGNLTTAGVVAATGNVSGGNLTTAGVVSASGNISGANLLATSFYVRSITTGISAAGSTQGTATALTKEINIVSTVTSGQGVVLPSAVAGMVLIVNNTSANTLSVYPATGAAINSGAANAAYSHSSGASIQYYATSGTQWYTVGATFA